MFQFYQTQHNSNSTFNISDTFQDRIIHIIFNISLDFLYFQQMKSKLLISLVFLGFPIQFHLVKKINLIPILFDPNPGCNIYVLYTKKIL